MSSLLHPARSVTMRRLLLAALLALPAAARAQGTLTFASSLNNPVANNVYVGPYGGATFVNAVGQSQLVAVLCVDYLNHVGWNDSYAVSVNSLGGVDDLSESRHPGAMLTYRKAAWLGSLFGTRSQTDWGSIHHAIWNLFTPVEAPEYGQSNAYLALADVAASYDFGAFDDGSVHYDAVDMSRWTLLTDVAAAGQSLGGHQEFLVESGPSIAAVPEPSTLALIGTGLLGVIGLVLRERREQRRDE